MSTTFVQSESFKWVDYLNPSKQVLEQLATELNLEQKVVVNCLDSDYLPHIETYDKTHFIVLRFMEPESKISADSVQELTTKVAIFIAQDQLVTIHRLPLIEIDVVSKAVQEFPKEDVNKQKILSLIYEQAAIGFDRPLSDLENKLQSFEDKLFSKKKSKNFLQEGFYLKRKASAFRKVLKLSLELINKLVDKVECNHQLFQRPRERLERSLFYAEDVTDNIQSLLNLHIGIESQKTNEASFRANEIMRVLTVISIFFLPLNFLSGVFGMNFEHIPLLSHPLGFWASILVMVSISVILTAYLNKQGWLSRPQITGEGNKNEPS
ncbi:MAG: CorA family divalent cation transporter [Pseudobdellovibrio sp.]